MDAATQPIDRPARRRAATVGFVLGAIVVCLTATGLFLLTALIAVFSGPFASVDRTLGRRILAVGTMGTNAVQCAAILLVAVLVSLGIVWAGRRWKSLRWTIVGAFSTVVMLGAFALLTSVMSDRIGHEAAGAADAADAAIAAATGPAASPAPIGPEPAPTADALSYDEARAEFDRMLDLTLSAVPSGPVDADGSVLLASDIDVTVGACNETGANNTAVFTLAARNGDNAAALTAILAAWDAAGYLPDRAMQTDIRYSPTLPIERADFVSLSVCPN
ncbi:hypothetical protein [Microbacterium sp.]|uniref:hypothetical protein n=1 Tax=Microbacterium sp. TaxID=51671 RepID=UPI0039E46EBD